MKNLIKDLPGSTWFVLIAMALFVIWIVTTLVFLNGIEEETDKHKVLMGEQIVISGDTLTAIDYNSLTETIVLSSGTKVSTEFFNNQKLPK